MPGDLRRILLRLVSAALVLPIAILLVLAVARLLSALGDAAGAVVFDRIALLLGLVWLLVVICLPIVTAVQSLSSDARDEDEIPSEENEH